MEYINFSAPINSLSFGNVSFNMLREFYKLDQKICFFPIGDKIDMSAFDRATPDLKNWISESYNNRLLNLSANNPSLKMWHLNSSESRIGPRQILYTFYECNKPTLSEKNLCNTQDLTIFSSSYARDSFSESGCKNIDYVPIGLDPDVFQTGRDYLDRINFGLVGKFEKRKHTARILKLWAEKYGNNMDYQLTCCIHNPFIKDDQMKLLILQALDGKIYKNINFLNRLSTNSEMNELYNAIDINLSGLSGAEGWNLPAFNSTCLGKWSLVLNCTSHKDWANKDNSIIVEPSGEEDIYDGIFFQEGQPFNQGTYYTFSDEDFYKSTEKALSKVDKENSCGLKLKDKFNYKKTVKKLIEIIKQ